MSRVLITGIEGFVGGHLARRLLDDGHDVSGVHIADTSPMERVELHQGDIREFEWLKSVLEKTRPDRVVHLAAVSSVAESETHVLWTYDINAVGTLNLLEAVRLSGMKTRILLISSADVYGRAVTDAPLTEDTLPPELRRAPTGRRRRPNPASPSPGCSGRSRSRAPG